MSAVGKKQQKTLAPEWVMPFSVGSICVLNNSPFSYRRTRPSLYDGQEALWSKDYIGILKTGELAIIVAHSRLVQTVVALTRLGVVVIGTEDLEEVCK